LLCNIDNQAIYFIGLQMKDFIESIKMDRAPAVSGSDGRRVVALFNAIYKSAKENRPVKC